MAPLCKAAVREAKGAGLFVCFVNLQHLDSNVTPRVDQGEGAEGSRLQGVLGVAPGGRGGARSRAEPRLWPHPFLGTAADASAAGLSWRNSAGIARIDKASPRCVPACASPGDTAG